jgi:hypothetical protein
MAREKTTQSTPPIPSYEHLDSAARSFFEVQSAEIAVATLKTPAPLAAPTFGDTNPMPGEQR